MTSPSYILNNRTPWPNKVRGFPKSLITSGAFAASQSTKSFLGYKSLYKKINTPGIETEYSVEETLSIRHFRVLLELIDMVKGLEVCDSYEFSPGKLLERLHLKRTGTAYSDLIRMVEELAELKINITDTFLSSGEVVKAESSLFSFIEAGSIAYEGRTKVELIDEAGRPVWNFKFSDIMIDMLREGTISTIHTKTLRECGRSPLVQWMFLFYSTHGADGKHIFEYKALKLATICSLERGYATTKNKLKNQLVHRVKQAVQTLDNLKVFKKAIFERSNAKTDTYHAFNRIVRFGRFTYEYEEALSTAPLKERTALHIKLLT
jgi:hypothetical protein